MIAPARTWTRRCALGLLIAVGALHASAQTSWLQRYEARLAETLDQQPHWATPLVTTSPRVEEDIRTDFVRQSIANGQQTWNYGSTKGLQIVPFSRVELRFSPPPFITHTNPELEDGFGDVAFRAKVRLYGSNEQHHNAIISALLAASVPTGKSGNGSCCAILMPTLEAGKGWRRADVVTSFGGSLPVSNAAKLGRQFLWSNALQYHGPGLVWFDMEFSSTFYYGGSNDGKQQTFVTPGASISRIPLTLGNGTVKPRLTLAAGEQIAITHFNTYNHSPIFSARIRF
jgi:hypothetical protein